MISYKQAYRALVARKSLRDQMAMAALPWVVEAQGEVEAAQRAYRYADAMLLARRGK
jgi:hypothetical protein